MPDDKGLTHQDLIDRLPEDDVLEAIIRKAIPASARLSLDDIQSITDQAVDIMKKGASKKIDAEGEVYIAQVEFPAQGVTYLTLVTGGQFGFSGTEEGLSINDLSKQGLVGYDSLEDVMANVFGASPIPATQHVRKKTIIKKPTTQRRAPVPRPPKDKPQYVIDPKLAEYLRNKEAFLSTQAFTKGQERGRNIRTREELEDFVGQETVEEFIDGGFNVTLLTPVNFVKENAKPIRKSRKHRREAIVQDERVMNLIRNYFKTIAPPKDVQPIIDHLSVASNVVHCYNYFIGQDHRIEGVRIEEVLDAMQYVAVRIVENDSKRRAQVVRGMHEMINIVKAARFIEDDEYIRKAMAFFDDAKDTEDMSISDTVYEGMRQVVAHMLDRNQYYSPGELPFIARGLWLKGYFVKHTKDSDEQGEEIREPRGVIAQFVHPAR
jgi:hypothetical protein